MWSLGLFTSAFVVPAAIGLILTILGIRGRRVGDAPHCRKCGYNLTGIKSERCPECGRPWTLTTAVIGERRRRPRMVLVGLILFLPATGLVITAQTDWARSIDWYQKLPTWWILFEARSAKEAWALRAFKELERREKAGELDAEDRSRLLDAALSQFSRRRRVHDPQTEIEDVVAIRLDEAARKRQLSAEQLERLCDRLIWVSWRSRPIVALGDSIPLEWGVADYEYGFDDFVTHIEIEEISLAVNGRDPILAFQGHHVACFYCDPGDDLELPEPFGESRALPVAGGFTGWAPPTPCWQERQRWLVKADEPGRYEFRIRCRMGIHQAWASNDSGRRDLLYETTRTYVARSQVLDSPSRGHVRFVKGAAIKRQMERCLSVETACRALCLDEDLAMEEEAEHREDEDDERPCIEVAVDADGPLPVGIAYTARIEGPGWTVDAHENPFYAEEMLVEKGLPGDIFPTWRGGACWSLTFWAEDPIPERIDLVLTPDPALAKRSVSLAEICGETLRFEGIRVHPSAHEAYAR